MLECTFCVCCCSNTPTLLCRPLQAPAAGLTGWRRSETGKFSVVSGAEDDSGAGSTPEIIIEQEDAYTNAYVYQRALAVRARASEPTLGFSCCAAALLLFCGGECMACSEGN